MSSQAKKGPCSCSDSKNKTPKSYLTKELVKDAVGTGLFAVPAPQKGILEKDVVVVHDLTYLECIKRGHNCLAFKWVPASVMIGADIIKARATTDCGDISCSEDDDCPPPCLACQDTGYCY